MSLAASLRSSTPKNLAAAIASSKLAQAAVVALACLAWTALIRWPFRDYSNPDEGFFTEVALLWRAGHLPYVAAFDVKPPGFFAVLAVSQELFGAGPAALHAIGLVSDASTAALLFFMGRAFGSSKVGAFAALALALPMQTLARNDAYSLMLALTTLAMALAASGLPPRRRALLAGLAIGAAGMVKQTVALEALALAAILIFDISARGRRASTALALAAGAAAAPTLVGVYFAAHGALGPLIEDVFAVALARPGAASDNVSFVAGLARFAGFASEIAPILLLASVTALWQWVPRASPARLRPLAPWFVAALCEAILQRSLLSAYLSPLVPPALLLAGFGVANAWPPSLRSRPVAAAAALAFIVAEVCMARRIGAERPSLDLHTIRQAAEAIRSAGGRDSDRLFFTNGRPEGVWLYAESGLTPATPYLIPSQSLCDFPGVGPGKIDEALRARPRFIVVSHRQLGFGCEAPGARDKTNEALARHYRSLATVGANGDDAYDLFERSDPR